MTAAWRGSRKGAGPGFRELVRDDLKTRNYRPVYILAGEDVFRQESVVNHIKDDVLGEANASFNFHLFQGDQVNVDRVLQQANSFPMLGGRQLIWVRQADLCISDQSSGDALCAYAENPVEQTILVLTAEKLDKRKKWVKTCRSLGFVFELVPPGGEDLVDWTLKAARRVGLPLDRDMAGLLIDLVGADLFALSAEIDKLALLVEDTGQELNSETLAAVIMDQARLREFDINNNLGPGQADTVLKVWYRLARWGKTAYEIAPLVLWRIRMMALVAASRKHESTPKGVALRSGVNQWTCQQLIPVVDRLGEAGVRRAVTQSQKCDASLKSSPVDPAIILEKTLVDICAPAPGERK